MNAEQVYHWLMEELRYRDGAEAEAMTIRVLETVFWAGCWTVALEAIAHGIKQGDPIPPFDVAPDDLKRFLKEFQETLPS